LRETDPAFDATARLVFTRPPYEIADSAELPQQLASACSEAGRAASFTAMSFWTDAAILGGAGIPAVLFGPGGAGLHSREEFVKLDEVIACEQILRSLARRFL
jgi:acetylornithine deacetylase